MAVFQGRPSGDVFEDLLIASDVGGPAAELPRDFEIVDSGAIAFDKHQWHEVTTSRSASCSASACSLRSGRSRSSVGNSVLSRQSSASSTVRIRNIISSFSRGSIRRDLATDSTEINSRTSGCGSVGSRLSWVRKTESRLSDRSSRNNPSPASSVTDVVAHGKTGSHENWQKAGEALFRCADGATVEGQHSRHSPSPREVSAEDTRAVDLTSSDITSNSAMSLRSTSVLPTDEGTTIGDPNLATPKNHLNIETRSTDLNSGSLIGAVRPNSIIHLPEVEAPKDGFSFTSHSLISLVSSAFCTPMNMAWPTNPSEPFHCSQNRNSLGEEEVDAKSGASFWWSNVSPLLSLDASSSLSSKPESQVDKSLVTPNASLPTSIFGCVPEMFKSPFRHEHISVSQSTWSSQTSSTRPPIPSILVLHHESRTPASLPHEVVCTARSHGDVSVGSVGANSTCRTCRHSGIGVSSKVDTKWSLDHDPAPNQGSVSKVVSSPPCTEPSMPLGTSVAPPTCTEENVSDVNYDISNQGSGLRWQTRRDERDHPRAGSEGVESILRGHPHGDDHREEDERTSLSHASSSTDWDPTAKTRDSRSSRSLSSSRFQAGHGPLEKPTFVFTSSPRKGRIVRAFYPVLNTLSEQSSEDTWDYSYKVGREAFL